ncbi:MAG: hypothetical protein NVSMB29_14070 [Candidatus Dormibacteria bacterium]
MTLDTLRLQVWPGDGLVARFDSAVLTVEGPPDSPEATRLVEICRGAGQPAALGAALKTSELFNAPPFCVVSGVGEELWLFVRGRAEMTIHGANYQIKVGGRAPVALVEKVVRPPLDALVTGAANAGVMTSEWLDLRRGVVPGGGAILRPRGAGTARG